MKGGKYAKTLAKMRVRGIFRIRDIRRNVLPKFIDRDPVWRRHAGAYPGTNMADGSQQQKHLKSNYVVCKAQIK